MKRFLLTAISLTVIGCWGTTTVQATDETDVLLWEQADATFNSTLKEELQSASNKNLSTLGFFIKSATALAAGGAAGWAAYTYFPQGNTHITKVHEWASWIIQLTARYTWYRSQAEGLTEAQKGMLLPAPTLHYAATGLAGTTAFLLTWKIISELFGSWNRIKVTKANIVRKAIGNINNQEYSRNLPYAIVRLLKAAAAEGGRSVNEDARLCDRINEVIEIHFMNAGDRALEVARQSNIRPGCCHN